MPTVHTAGSQRSRGSADNPATVTTSLKRDAASGLVVVVPLLFTAYVLWWLFQRIANVPLVGHLTPYVPFLRHVSEDLAQATLTLVVLAGTLVVLSWVMRTALGAVVETAIDDAVNRVPGFRVVYNASKLAVETAVDEDVELESPAKLHIWGDTRVTAFHTGRVADDGRVTLFVPASPLIFTGFVIEVDERRVVETNEPALDALIRVLSAGFADRGESGPAEPARVGSPASAGTARDEDGS